LGSETFQQSRELNLDDVRQVAVIEAIEITISSIAIEELRAEMPAERVHHARLPLLGVIAASRMCCEPIFEVMMMTLFLKSTVLPCPS
jgi:hypothetical protein